MMMKILKNISFVLGLGIAFDLYAADLKDDRKGSIGSGVTQTEEVGKSTLTQFEAKDDSFCEGTCCEYLKVGKDLTLILFSPTIYDDYPIYLSIPWYTVGAPLTLLTSPIWGGVLMCCMGNSTMMR